MGHRWLSVRLEMIGTSIIFSVALLVAAVLRIDAGLSGLALSTAMELTSYMNWAVCTTHLLVRCVFDVERHHIARSTTCLVSSLRGVSRRAYVKLNLYTSSKYCCAPFRPHIGVDAQSGSMTFYLAGCDLIPAPFSTGADDGGTGGQHEQRGAAGRLLRAAARGAAHHRSRQVAAMHVTQLALTAMCIWSILAAA